MSDPLDDLAERLDQMDRVMREYEALCSALIESEREINPELTWSETRKAVRTRFQRHLRQSPPPFTIERTPK